MRRLAYGRPSDRSVEAMLRERRGTCSAKHLYLARQLRERFPASEPKIVHRVYRLSRAEAEERHGAAVAATVPGEGLVDVHRYLTAVVAGRRIPIDATFPGPPWDGRTPMPIAAPEGTDFAAGEDPDADKRRLEAEHCDPSVREPFIAALSDSSPG